MMKTHVKLTLAVLTLFTTLVSSGTALAGIPTVPGLTPSTSTVTASGEFTYHVPIGVPAGINGLEPELTLNYSSGSNASDQLGVGWSISGLSRITRCDHNRLQDNVVKQVDYTTRVNRYCLDGQRLVPHDNNHAEYAVLNRKYRLEHDNYTKIQSFGWSGNGPTEFKVWKKSGEILSYGIVNAGYDSRIEAKTLSDGTVIVWALGQIEDRHGNKIRYTYGHDNNGHFRPERIDYAFHNGAHQAYLDFDYQDGVAIGHNRRRYFAGEKMNSRDRLSSITTYSRPTVNHGLQAVKSYRLGYRKSKASDRSLLTSVQECAYAAGVGNHQTTAPVSCFEPLEFAWEDHQRLLERHMVTSESNVDPAYKTNLANKVWMQSIAMPLDYNGDGLSDMLLFPNEKNTKDGRAYLLKGKRTGFSTVLDVTSKLNFKAIHKDARATVTDFNQDGFSDVIVSKYNYSDPNNKYNDERSLEIWIYPGTTSGLGSATLLYRAGVLAGDGYDVTQLSLDGDGLVDLLVRFSYAKKTPVPSLEGDTSYRKTTTNYADLLRNTSTKNTFSKQSTRVGKCDANGATLVSSWPAAWCYQTSHITVFDYNGDGLSDILSQSIGKRKNHQSWLMLNGGGSGSSTQFQRYSMGDKGKTNWHYGLSKGGFSDIARIAPGDFNGDGLDDLILQHYDDSHDSILRVSILLLSTGSRVEGDQFEAKQLSTTDGISNNNETWAEKYRKIAVFDINGDGADDVILQGALKAGYSYVDFETYEETDVETKYWASFVLKSNAGVEGKTAAFEKIPSNALSEVQTLHNTEVWSRGHFNLVTIDINNDGRMDLLQKHVNKYDVDQASYAMLSRPSSMDRINSITDSLDRLTTVEYGSLFDSSVYTRTQTSNHADIRFLAGAASDVVSSVTVTNAGAVAPATSRYKYYDLRLHKNRGVQGFQKRVQTNYVQRSGTLARLAEITELYHQDYPLTGAVHTTEVRTQDGNKLFLQAKTKVHTTATRSGKAPVYYFRINNNNTSNWTYSKLGTQLTYDYAAFSNLDAYGNVGKVTTTSTNNLAGTVQTTTISTYTNDTNNWILGRLKQSEVTHSASGNHYRGPAISRKSSFTYYVNTGSIKTETSYFPNQQSKTISYAYDNKGNVTLETVTASDSNPSSAITTRYDYSDSYGGRFRTSTTNALGHSESTKYDGRRGVATQHTGPNGLTTHWTHDNDARLIRETRADNTWTETRRYQRGLHNARGGIINSFSDNETWVFRGTNLAVLAEKTVQSTGARSISYSDVAGRVLRTVTFATADGIGEAPLVTQTLYDEQGRVWRQSQPVFNQEIANAGSYRYTTFTYDDQGRIKKESAPGNRITSYSYADNGTVTVTDPEKKKRYTRTGQEERELWSKDHQGNIINFYYDATGNLLLTKAGGQNYSVSYDSMGRKIAMSDPDMGNWSYAHNVLGQLVEQTDAKGQKVYFEYDKLGRKLKRWDVPAGKTKNSVSPAQWIYDTATVKGKGKLHRAIGGELKFQQIHFYDNLGRLSRVRTQLDQNGNGSIESNEHSDEVTTYDTAGRVSTRLNTLTGLKTENSYHRSGQLTMIKRIKAMAVTPGAAAKYTQLADNLVAQIQPYTNKQTEIANTRTSITTLTQSVVSLDADIDEKQAQISSVSTEVTQVRLDLDLIKAAHGIDVSLHGLGMSTPVVSFADPTQRTNYENARNRYFAFSAEQRTLETQLTALQTQHGEKTTQLTTLQNSLAQLETELAEMESTYATTTQAIEVLRLSAERITNGQGPVQSIYWKANTFDRWGKVTEARLGNGVTSIRKFYESTGNIEKIIAKAGSRFFQNDTYTYDKVGNLKSRNNDLAGINETFDYDNLYRLESSSISGKFSDEKSWRYAANGNMLNNASRLCQGITADCLKYTHTKHPQAVSKAGNVTYQYDNNGNMTSSSDGRAISWTISNKPKTLIQHANAHYPTTRSLSFAYGVDHQRIRQISVRDTSASDSDAVTETTWYRSGLVQIDKPGGVTELHQQIAVPGATVLVVRHDNHDGSVKGESTSYLHQDHLGSPSVITGLDGAGKIVVLEHQSYSAFGLSLKDNTDARTMGAEGSDITPRGYTGHETLTAFGLIQMNARLYDPVLGRFISADTFVQSPLNLQSYNRYSYVWNNPLSFTDPTGHFLSSGQRHWFKRNSTQLTAAVITIASTAALGPAGAGYSIYAASATGGALGAAWATAISGGSGEDIFINAFRTGVISATSAGIFDGIGANLDGFENVLAHGFARGYIAALQGESFQSGFISGTITAASHQFFEIPLMNSDNDAAVIVTSAVVGGLASEITGGSFANGAVLGSFQVMFNHLAHKSGGHQRHLRRKELSAKGSTIMPKLTEGRYIAVIDSISGELIVDIEMGDLWIIDSSNSRHLHFGFVGLGGGPTFGGSISRQYGALYVSSSSDVQGFAFHLETDGTPGVGGTSSFQLLNQSLDPTSVFGGIAFGLEAGISGVGSYTWFKKVYDANNSPLFFSP